MRWQEWCVLALAAFGLLWAAAEYALKIAAYWRIAFGA